MGSRVQGVGLRVQGLGFWGQGSGCRVKGSGFRVQGLGFWGPGFRVQGFRQLLLAGLGLRVVRFRVQDGLGA